MQFSFDGFILWFLILFWTFWFGFRLWFRLRLERGNYVWRVFVCISASGYIFWYIQWFIFWIIMHWWLWLILSVLTVVIGEVVKILILKWAGMLMKFRHSPAIVAHECTLPLYHTMTSTKAILSFHIIIYLILVEVHLCPQLVCNLL